MGASSVTGTGQGSCGKATLTDLAQQSLGPQIVYAGTAEIVDLGVSPTTYGATVTLPIPMPGVTTDPGSEYVVILTTLNGAHAYIMDMDDQDLDEDGEDDHFTGFTLVVEEECNEVFFIVVKKGIRVL